MRAIRTTRGPKFESLKVQLIKYYLSLNGVWDREKEKNDWRKNDLASLKYETYRFMIRVLAEIGDGHNSDLYAEIREMSSAMHIGATALAFDISNSSAQIAIEREEYSLAIHIIDLQAEILDELDVSDEADSASTKNQSIRMFASARLNELHICSEYRRNVLEPAKRLWVDLGRVPMEKFEEVQSALLVLRGKNVESPMARCDYWALEILESLMVGNLSKAEFFTIKLIQEYEASSILRVRHCRRYIANLQSASLLFAQIGNAIESKKYLGILHKISKEEHPFAGLAANSWLFCALRISHHFSDEKLFRRALSILQRGVDHASEQQADDPDSIKLEWLVLINHLEIGQLDLAYRVGTKLLGRKSSVRKGTIVSTRIAMFACEIALFREDVDRIESSYKATYQFIDRNRQEFSSAFAVLKAFKAIWNLRSVLDTSNADDVQAFPQSNIFDFSGLYKQVVQILIGRQQSQ